jgi:hypothetical protein
MELIRTWLPIAKSKLKTVPFSTFIFTYFEYLGQCFGFEEMVAFVKAELRWENWRTMGLQAMRKEGVGSKKLGLTRSY